MPAGRHADTLAPFRPACYRWGHARALEDAPRRGRRFTRLTNAVSKKLDNHIAAISLYFMHYNFGRVHMTLKPTPAIKAGIADHVWTAEEIA